MKINTSKIKIYGLILVVLILGFISFKIISIDNSSVIPEEKQCVQKPYFNLKNHIDSLNTGNLKADFPYEIYLDSANYCDIASIHKHLEILNTLNRDAKENKKILVKALTEKLEEKIGSRFNTYQPDSIILMLNWVNKFQYYKDIDTNNLKLYRMVHRHWYNYFANKLSQYNDSDANLKYEFKFKYLLAMCQSKNYPPDIRNSSITKIIDNVVNNKWAYLFKRFWDGTGFLVKLLLSAAILFTFYSYYCVYKLHFNKGTK
jgi:hypothetical protein